jgi:hypothetical protein
MSKPALQLPFREMLALGCGNLGAVLDPARFAFRIR